MARLFHPGAGGASRAFRIAAGLGAALQLAVALEYVLRSPYAYAPLVDSRYYWMVAYDTAMSGRPLPAVFFGAPFYPLFLCAYMWVFGPNPAWLPFLQTGLALATIFLLHRTILRILGRAAADWSALLLLFYGPFAFQSLKILPDTWGLFFFALYLRLFVSLGDSGGRAVVLGLVSGVMALCRAQLLPAALLTLSFRAAFPVSRGRIRVSLLALASLALALLPFCLYSLSRAGHFSPFSPYGGLSLYEGNNPRAFGTYTRVVGSEDRMEKRLDDMAAEASRQLGRPVGPYEADSFFRMRALSFALENPGRFLVLEAKKLYLLLTPAETYDLYDMGLERRFLPLLRLLFGGWWLILPLSLTGAAALLRDPEARRAAMPFTVSALCQIAILLVFFINSRYRLLLVPALAPFFGAGAALLSEKARARRFRDLALAALPLLLMIPWAALSGDSHSFSARESVGKALAEAGRTDEALAVFNDLAREQPGSLELVNSLVLLHIFRGDFARAEPLLARLAADPQFSRLAAHYRLMMDEARRRFGSPGQSGVTPSPAFRAFLNASADRYFAASRP